MDAWDFLVDRADLSRTTFAPAKGEATVLEDGEVLLAIERFALTANNITYAAIGDSPLGYWKFFPAPDGMGRIPAWGFATVIRSKAEGVEAGLRLFGYWPMSTHLVARLQPTAGGYVDASPHRAALPPTYNSYSPAPEPHGDDHRALLQPLAGTGFLLDDALADDPDLKDLVLSSASSKTALSLAWFAKQRGAWRVTGLTSADHVATLEAFGLYDRVLAYDDLSPLGDSRPTAYVDFAGRKTVNHQVHEILGEALKTSLIVGLTHRDATAAEPPKNGPRPTLFFAPDRLGKIAAEQGMGRMIRAIGDFAAAATWLAIQPHRGPEALAAIYQDVLAGRTRPQDGHIVTPR